MTPREVDDVRYLESSLTLALDAARCSGCGECARVCPRAVLRLTGRQAVLADRGACMECGACARNCPTGAVTVRAGVGCAAGLMAGLLVGGAPTCGSTKGGSKCC